MANPREHAWLTEIVNSSQDAIIVIDANRTIQLANDAAVSVADANSSAELLGRSYDEILRQSQVFEEDGTPADPNDFPSTQALRTGRTTKGKLYERLYKGSHAWLRIDAIPIPDTNGKPEFCIIRFADVSDEKWKHDRLEFLLRSERILSLTSDYNARLVEKARLTVPSIADWCTLNISQRDGTVRRIAIVHRDPSKEPLVQRLAELSEIELGQSGGVAGVIATGEPYFIPDISYEFIKAQPFVSAERRQLMEQLQVCSSMTLPIVSRGTVLGALTVAYGESNRHYAQRDLEFMSEFCSHLGVAVDNARLYEDIKARDKAKDDFLAALSHELRNPLAPIKSSLELLMLSRNPHEQNEELELVEKQFDHLTSILNDLLDVTRYMRGMIRLEKQQVDLAQLLRQVARSYAGLANERRINLETSIPEDPVFVWGDPVRLRQACMNLLDNAQKFTPQGGSIRVSLEQLDEALVVTVDDTGVGIPQNEIERIFDLHFQGSNKLRTHNAGLGLGLVLVKNIVDLHGGKITAASEGVDRGTEFRITLPAFRPEAGVAQN
ncbi:MAG: ATP-binding protein [Candidatus Pacebacteria bacterium]|nr:ATP-binding protein [Candidatus Paceibacterota bacterium]